MKLESSVRRKKRNPVDCMFIAVHQELKLCYILRTVHRRNSAQTMKISLDCIYVLFILINFFLYIFPSSITVDGWLGRRINGPYE